MDGVYSSRPALTAFVDLAVFVDTTQCVRDESIASRNHGTYPEYVDDDFLRRDADDPIAQLATVEPAPRRTLTNPLGEASADG